MTCPKHPKVKLRESFKGGWYCPAKNDNGKYCDFTTQVENDTPAPGKTYPIDPVISKAVESFMCPGCRQRLRVYAEV